MAVDPGWLGVDDWLAVSDGAGCPEKIVAKDGEEELVGIRKLGLRSAHS